MEEKSKGKKILEILQDNYQIESNYFNFIIQANRKITSKNT